MEKPRKKRTSSASSERIEARAARAAALSCGWFQRCKSRRDTATPARSPCGARRALRACRRARRRPRGRIAAAAAETVARVASSATSCSACCCATRRRLSARLADDAPLDAEVDRGAARRSRASRGRGDDRASPHPADRDGANRVARSRRVGRPRHDARRSLAARGMPHRSGARATRGEPRAEVRPAARRGGRRVAVARARHGQARRRRAELLVGRRPRVPVPGRRRYAGSGKASSPRRTTCALGQLLIKLLDQRDRGRLRLSRRHCGCGRSARAGRSS